MYRRIANKKIPVGRGVQSVSTPEPAEPVYNTQLKSIIQ